VGLLRRRTRPEVVTFVTRSGCHLCEVAEPLVRAAAADAVEARPERVVEERDEGRHGGVVGEPGGGEERQERVAEPCRGGALQRALGHDLGHGRVGDAELVQAGEEAPQLVLPGGGRVDRAQRLQRPVGHQVDESLLAGHVVVERHRGHAELGGDAPHGHGGEAVGVGDRERRGDHGGDVEPGG
jgi:hypothetical protein